MWQRWNIALLAAMGSGSALARPLVPAAPAVEAAPATAPTTAPIDKLGTPPFEKLRTPPASQPVVPAEPATPRDALKIFAAAMRDGDASRLKSVVLTDSPSEVRMLGAMAGLAGSLARLNQSAVKAFGEEEARGFTDDSAAHFSENMSRIEAAEVTIDGDKATVRYRGPGETPFEMRRVSPARGSQEGAWKVPMSALSPGADAAALDQRLGELNVEQKIVDELADEITAGKYKNAEAGKEAWRGKIMQILPSRPPGTGPVTRTAG